MDVTQRSEVTEMAALDHICKFLTRIRRGSRWGGLIVLLVFPLHIQGCSDRYESARLAGKVGPFSVTGFLVAPKTAVAEEAQDILTLDDYVFVPGVTVWLHDERAGTESPEVRTDLSGRFTFPPQPPGRYRVCWKADGFVSGCVGPQFPVVDEHVFLGPLKIGIISDPHAKVLFGNVRFKDGSLPRAFEPLANVNAFARVHAFDSGGSDLLPPAYVNNYGEYILPQVDMAKLVTLKAVIEEGSGSSGLDGVTDFPRFHRVDLVIDNRPPKLSALLGKAPGGRRWTANPGDTMEMTALAEDKDGDPVQYQWIMPESVSLLSPLNAQTVKCKLPNWKALYEATVVVYDNKGGYARETLKVSTKGVRFTGTVIATDRPFVPGAQIEVNGGGPVTTNSEGHFEVVVAESPTYVLNIRKQGYALVSKVYNQGLMGGRWALTRATVSSEDPKKDIDVMDIRRPDDCLGSLSSRIDPQREGRTAYSRRERRRDCGPGIRVHIPANSLVDEDGNPPPPNATLQVARSTIDVEAPDGMPGDYTAMDKNGDVQIMETFGGGFVEVTGGGKAYKLDLSKGATAEITIPIPPSVLASRVPLPATIPFFSYDETDGIWKEEGTAKRDGKAYKAIVRHFSAINMNLLNTNQACLRLETVVMPPSFDLEVKILPGGGGGGTTKTETITNANQRLHVLYNLPTTQTVELRAFQMGTATPIDFLVPGATPGTITSSSVISVSSIPAQNPAIPNRPEFPYAACKKSIELSPFRLPSLTVDSFLAGLNFPAVNLTELEAASAGSSALWITASEAYYDTIDPQGLRETLDEFKTQNGFPADEIVTHYANSADLGFGREMHCRRQSVLGLAGFDVACYVTNYGDRFTDDNQDFIDAVNKTNPIATVGMEFSRIENPSGSGFVSDTRVVKFYVFKAATGFSREPSANLDGFGERPIPQLCMTCHGGRYPAGLVGPEGTPTWDKTKPETANLGSSFLPFDLIGLHTPVYNGTDYKATQQGKFKDLNTKIVWEAGNSSAIKEVIEGMYGSTALGFPEPNQVENFAVAGWNDASHPSGEPSPKETYVNVVAPSCRMCHTAQKASIVWNTKQQWINKKSFIALLVCNEHQMPHAIATHNRFWLSLSPHQPAVMHNFLNGSDPIGTGTASACIPPP